MAGPGPAGLGLVRVRRLVREQPVGAPLRRSRSADEDAERRWQSRSTAGISYPWLSRDTVVL